MEKSYWPHLGYLQELKKAINFKAGPFSVNMNPIKVSVIVPVFNAENFLETCIGSILNQTLQEIEIILINDGSTDNSKNIIVDFCKKDSRIILIDNVNGGVSKARNAGLTIAKGDYIGFVDADDFIHEEMFETLYTLAISNSSDLVVCNAFTENQNESTKTRLKIKDEIIPINSSQTENLIDFLGFKYDYANWNKLYSTNIIRQHNLHFNEEMTIWEDLLFNLVYLNFIPFLVTTERCLYHYRVHSTSIKNRARMEIATQYNLLYENYIRFCNKYKLLKAAEDFKKERSATCINNLVYFIEPPFSNKSLWNQSMRFRDELISLNPEIYLYGNTGLNSIIYRNRILRTIWLNIFPFTHLGSRYFKKSFRKLFTSSKG